MRETVVERSETVWEHDDEGRFIREVTTTRDAQGVVTGQSARFSGGGGGAWGGRLRVLPQNLAPAGS